MDDKKREITLNALADAWVNVLEEWMQREYRLRRDELSVTRDMPKDTLFGQTPEIELIYVKEDIDGSLKIIYNHRVSQALVFAEYVADYIVKNSNYTATITILDRPYERREYKPLKPPSERKPYGTSHGGMSMGTGKKSS